MKTNRSLCLLPILMAVLLASGCAKSDNSKGQADKTSYEQSMAEFEPLPIPEGGWTYEEVAKTVYINGKQISYPFTVESLGEGYYLKKKTTDNAEGEVATTLYYNKTPVCLLVYEYVESTRHIEREPVDLIYIVDTDYWENECAYEMIKANGVGISDDISAAKEVYGKPDFESESGNFCFYNCPGTENSSIYFHSDNGKIVDLYIRLTEKIIRRKDNN